MVLFVIIARSLGPETYGVYSLITVSILFLVTFFDFGIENIAVRFSGRYEDKRENIFGIYFFRKTIIASFLLITLIVFPSILSKLLNKPEAQRYIFIIFIGFILESYQALLLSYYQSMEKFIIRAAISIGSSLLRLMAILILLLFSVDNIRVISILFALSSLPVLVLFSRRFYDFYKKIILSEIDKALWKDMLTYGKWIFMAALPIQLMTRLDFYIVTRFSTFEEMGLYNSAVQLVSLFSYLPVVFGTVFLPKASRYKDMAHIYSYIKKVKKIGILITVVIIGLIPFSSNLIYIFLGEKYLKSFPIFQVLLFAFVFTLWNILLGTVFYALGKVKYMTFGAYVQLITFIGGVLIFAPLFRINAIIWSMVFANAAYLGIVVYYLKIIKSYAEDPFSKLVPQ